MSDQPYAAGPLLSKITEPADLRRECGVADLPQVCDELRQFIVEL